MRRTRARSHGGRPRGFWRGCVSSVRQARARPHGGARPAGFWRGCVSRCNTAADPGRWSIKRVASAVGEGAVVISQVHAYLNEVRQAGP